MPPLHIEVLRPDSNVWVPLPPLNAGDRYGSISDNSASGRSVYIFGVDAIENVGVVQRSTLGVDTTSAQNRQITAIEPETVAELRAGESHELQIKSDRSSKPSKIRFLFID